MKEKKKFDEIKTGLGTLHSESPDQVEKLMRWEGRGKYTCLFIAEIILI